MLSIKEPTIKEMKTGKSKRIYIPKKLRAELLQFSRYHKKYIFESNTSNCGHITRQAVWKHFKKVANLIGLETNIGTHTMRKNKVLSLMQKGKDYKYIKSKLNHDNLGDTLLYMLRP
jgi:site-specific recombinase XerD